MAGFQNSNKLYTDSSNTNTALTTASAHYSQNQQLPTTPSSPTHNTTSSSIKTESPRTTTIKNTKITTSTTSTNTKSNTSSSNPTSPAGSRSLTSTATQTNPPVSVPPSAFSPYNNQHPVPVTNSTKSSISEPTTMMTASPHLDNSGSTTLIGYPHPPHTHLAANHAPPFWPNQWGFGGANGTAVLSATGSSAFVPAVGYGGTASNLAQGHTPRPKLTTTIWEDEQTLCYQVDARGICVARRQDNDMINGTKLLNVVGMSRGKRDGILKNEKGRVVVKVGAMHLKGVWITFQRAKTLAAQFKISELLYPLFVDDPSIFLHNSYGPPMSARIPSIGAGPGSQWRPTTHPYANNFNNSQYAPETTRQWYPYGSGPLMTSPSTQGQEQHGTSQYPQNPTYSDRSASTAPSAVPIYHPNSRSHNPHPQAHLEDYDAATTNYNLMNGQSHNQQGGVQGVTVVSGGTAVSSYNLSPTEFKSTSTAGLYAIPQNAGYFGPQQRPTPPPSSYDISAVNRSSNTNSPSHLYNNNNTHIKTEDSNANNGNGYMRSGQGLYNLVTAAEAQPSTQIIGQKRGYVDDDNDDYNASNNNPASPPLTVNPPPLNNIAVTTAMNVAAGSFPSPMHVSPNSPNNPAFGWNKRVKYEQYSDVSTPGGSSSSHSSPSPRGFQLPGLGAGPTTPGANPSTPGGYNPSNLQMVTSAQNSHHYSPANTGPATGTTTPTTDNLGYFDQASSTVLHSPDNSEGAPEEPITGRRYDQYRQREDPPATEELTGY